MNYSIYRVGVNVTHYRRMLLIGCLLSVLVTAVVVSIIAVSFMTNMKLSYEKQITELHQQLDTNEEKYAHLVNQLNRSYDQKTEKLNNDVTSLSTQVSELTNKLDTYAKDSFELFRKYWFIAKEAPDDSGLDTNVIMYMDEEAKKLDINPNLLACIYRVESHFRTYVDNYGGSSARGLGQVIRSTGKAIWENILHKGAYNHDMAYDPYVNIEITATLIARNIKSTGDLYQALNLYSGNGRSIYYNKIVDVANRYGVDLSVLTYR